MLIEGTYTYADGSSFSGNFFKNKKDGKGVLKLASGITIKANWVDDMLEGKGTISEGDNSIEVKFHMNVAIPVEIPRPKAKGRMDRGWFNTFLTASAAGCVVGYYAG